MLPGRKGSLQADRDFVCRMSVAALVTLFLTLAVLAAAPGVSVLTVVARATAGGPVHGVLAALGVTAGDVFYILVALFGLNALADLAMPWLAILQVAAAGLLGVFAWWLWHAQPADEVVAGRPGAWASFGAGLAVTLADHKAIVFYLVLFPAFVDLPALGAGGVATVLAVAVVAVLGAKTMWALAAGGLAQRWRGQALWLQRAAAVVLVGVAVAMLLRGAAT